MSKTILFLVFLIEASQAASLPKFLFPTLDGRIVGGEKTTIEEHPWQVQIMYDGTHFCGGVLIAPFWILTAAACFNLQGSSSIYSVRLGSTSCVTGGMVIQALTYYRHPKFNQLNFDYNAGLLQLSQSVAYRDGINPVRIALPREMVPQNTMAKTTGWGATLNPGESSENLRVVAVPLVDMGRCRAQHGLSTITERMLCAGYDEGGKDTCIGDAGGPMICYGSVIGLTSGGQGCAKPGYPGIYTRVNDPEIYDWIVTTTGMFFNK